MFRAFSAPVTGPVAALQVGYNVTTTLDEAVRVQLVAAHNSKVSRTFRSTSLTSCHHCACCLTYPEVDLHGQP